jgi:hypothetical protein
MVYVAAGFMQILHQKTFNLELCDFHITASEISLPEKGQRGCSPITVGVSQTCQSMFENSERPNIPIILSSEKFHKSAEPFQSVSEHQLWGN